MAEVQWYYARDNQQFGPVSASELKQLAEAGRLSPDDLLWREGMDSWATAINLADCSTTTVPRRASKWLWPRCPSPRRPRRRSPRECGPARLLAPAPRPRSPRAVLRTTQTILWLLCVFVVLVGVVLFTRAFLRADNPAEEASAGAVFSTFFIAAYVLARSGEKLCRLLVNYTRRRQR